MFKNKLFFLHYSYLLFIIYFLLFLSGCATAPKPAPLKAQKLPGIYHKVERGETLWRISKMYNSGLEELVKVNRITEAAKIGAGQLIFIPGGKKSQTAAGVLPAEDFIWPVKGKVVLNFGQIANNTVNKGIDIEAHSASNIVASRSGTVVFYNPDFGGFGKTIIIDHKDGFSTVYARNSQAFIKLGDTVEKGSKIAKSRYLHFEIRKGLISQNPGFYLP